MVQVGVDYVSDPSGFIAASREAAESAAKAVSQFDLTDKSIRRMAVAYAGTADAAKQAALIQGMANQQAMNDAAKGAATQIAAQREIQAVSRETAVVQEQSARRSGAAAQLFSAVFKPDNLRSFRSDAKEASLAGEGLGKSLAVLGGSVAITAAAAPLLTHAFSLIQGPANALDKALFGDSERAKELAKQAQATADALIKAFGVEAMSGSLKNVGDLDTKTRLLTASVSDLRSQSDVTMGHLSQAASAFGLTSEMTGELTKTAKAAADAAASNAIQIEQEQRHLVSLAAQLGDTGAAANGYSKELALVNAMGVDIVNAGPAEVSALAAIGNQMDAAAQSAANLAATASAAQASIAALIAADSNLPPVLAQARTNAAGAAIGSSVGAALAQAGSIAALRAQGEAYNAAAIPKVGGGGGGGYTAAQAAKDTQSDALANLRARIQAEQQIHPSSVAYDKQMVVAAQDTLAVARSAEKHAQAVVQHANGEKARHAALQVLHSAQSLTNAAQKDVTRLQNEGKTLALAAKKSALELSNAQLEATSNMADQATADAVHIKEAQAALALDKKNSLAYWQDLKTLNEAKATAATDAADAAKQAADAAKQAKQDQIALANSIIEAGIDYSDPLSALRAAVAEAQNTLSGDTAGTTQSNLDTAALHQAQQQLADALAQNTAATATNTAAMTTGGPLNQLPSYLALRAGANSEAYLGGAGGGMTARNGGAKAPIHIEINVQTNDPDAIAQALNVRLSRAGSSVRL